MKFGNVNIDSHFSQKNRRLILNLRQKCNIVQENIFSSILSRTSDTKNHFINKKTFAGHSLKNHLDFQSIDEYLSKNQSIVTS